MSTESARVHLRKLQRFGIGYLAVSEASGVNHNIVWEILKGEKQRARFGTVQRILGVDKSCARDGTRIRATETWRILNRLFEEGYSKTQIAFWLGCRSRTGFPALQIRPDFVTAATATKVKRLAILLEAGKVKRGEALFPPVKPRGRPAMPTGSSAEHGTYGRYSYGCRCEPCRDAKRKYCREWKRNVFG